MKRTILETDILHLKPCCCLCQRIWIAWIYLCIKYYNNTRAFYPCYLLLAMFRNFVWIFRLLNFSLLQERQIVLLLNGTTSDSSGHAQLMMVQTSDLPFVPISRSTSQNIWNLEQLQVGLSHALGVFSMLMIIVTLLLSSEPFCLIAPSVQCYLHV